MVRKILSVMCIWVVVQTVHAAQNQIDGLRIWPSLDNTRIVLDMSSAPEFTYFPLKNPHRLVIDLSNTSDSKVLSLQSESGDLVRKVRYSTPKNKHSARVVIELNRAASPSLFAMTPTKPYGHRLVIDLKDSGAPAASLSSSNTSASSKSPSNSSTSSVVMDGSSSHRNRDIIVAIDAGHGGEDPGSIGPAGTYEKHITLSIAKKLEAMINGERGMRAIMTRSGDYYVSPNKRPELARKKKADLLISIHADAFSQPQPKGGSVWVLSMRRADTELGRWLEKSERHSELLGGAAEVISDKSSERYLAETILGLSMDHSMATSHDLGNKVIEEMKQVTSLHKRSPQAASFAVLTAPDIPSILVEVGFISNPQEEKNLNWGKHREKLAKAMFTAAKRYFKQVPPDGTLWALERADSRTHTVRSGESLSLLAQRYNVNVSRLKAANNLNSDVVRIGQILTIPRT
ncbi:N-acetylmuramoyl-L-alanine amidase [Alteromonas sp. 38]|uniref:N-acetylmuramoyl-L-alanine amidase n=1 Tax=unclassified Alteromonas TaxID=2614992 RepID=UPI0012F06ACF|nr:MULTISPECIES: N-acetylmuramoyl-L-alanine amidase [unclassified Alteromonas]CAD5249264.1 N-acetylmuramoyl-L-alanine amidase [Alteromonas sp. 154]VXC46597.1 N-acetylmuramoyl-L-alanine amidase [Alteromonas sp. 38]